jgi:hypothetical protein
MGFSQLLAETGNGLCGVAAGHTRVADDRVISARRFGRQRLGERLSQARALGFSGIGTRSRGGAQGLAARQRRSKPGNVLLERDH